MIIQELMPYGDLQGFLENIRLIINMQYMYLTVSINGNLIQLH